MTTAASPHADWISALSPLIGRRLDALIWMPMISDTPQLVAEFEGPAFSFTGSVFLSFEGASLILSWRQVGYEMVLDHGPRASWGAHTLDRVRIAMNGAWTQVEGSVLKQLELFTGPTMVDPEGEVMALRLALENQTRRSHVWIGVGGPAGVFSMDDLWVAVDMDPPNRVDLSLLATVPA